MKFGGNDGHKNVAMYDPHAATNRESRSRIHLKKQVDKYAEFQELDCAEFAVAILFSVLL
jgi:hypothetical protein